MGVILLNKVQQRYVVYHKLVERRMDGSAGSAFAALLETVAKDDYYFSGVKFTDKMQAKHIVTNDPGEIISLCGYKPVQSDCEEAFATIKALLDNGEKVLFCGTPQQCLKLKQEVLDSNNLVLVDIISTPFISQELLDKYAKELGEEMGSAVTDIRFYNKEFSYKDSKRVTFANGRTSFPRERDAFDILVDKGAFTPKDSHRELFASLEERIGDITLGAYNYEKANDGLGYAYLSVNTGKGAILFQKAKKRLIVLSEGEDVKLANVLYKIAPCRDNVNVDMLQDNSLDAVEHQLFHIGLKARIIDRVKHYLRVWKMLGETSRWNPRAVWMFVKYNLQKNVHTNLRLNGFIFFAPQACVSIDKTANITLNGPLRIGVKRISSSKQETRLWMQPKSKLLVHRYMSMGGGANVEIYTGGLLEVGVIASNAEYTIICNQHIKIGSPCNIARNATIRDTSGHLVAVPGFKKCRPVELGNHSWICTESTIMPGVTVGDGAIVGACSFVTKNVLPFTMVQGSPIEEIGKPRYFRI